MSALTVVDAQGQPVRLGPQMARGGEGVIYPVESRAGLVAKVYLRPPDAEKAEKLAVMARSGTKHLTELTSWPASTLHEHPGGPVVGLLMPLITNHKPIHQLYSPKARLNEFPQASWRFLIHAAANVARAVDAVHAHGHVIGDINHSGVLVSSEATVKLIDCDSFQVVVNGRHYPCAVGVPDFTPPELHGRPLGAIIRTPNHDAFGLAVLIFHLLFMGRHPFAGKFRGTGEMPIPRAIADGRFAYSKRAAQLQMEPPPGSLALAGASAPVADLFERAFAPASAGSRPTASEWAGMLTQLSHALRTCPRNAVHFFATDLTSCPWCAIEASVGVLLFPVVTPVIRRSGTSFKVETIWAAIAAVPSPGACPALPAISSFAALPDSSIAAVQRARRRRKVFAVTVVIALSLAWIIISPGTGYLGGLMLGIIGWGYTRTIGDDMVTTFRKNLEEAKMQADLATKRWEREGGDSAFSDKRRALESVRATYLGLEGERQRIIREARSHLRERQLQAYLERHRLRNVHIVDIGPGRKATLLSFGIETAADIHYAALARVPGFGPVLTSRLIDWRRTIEMGFRFDPSRSLDPADQAKIDQSIDARRSALEAQLLAGPAELERIRQHSLAIREALRPEIERILAALAQAEANARAIS